MGKICLALALSLFGCETTSNKNSCSGAGLNQSPACVACIAASCGTQANACYGANWQSGDFTGGMCDPYFACTCKCAKGDNACVLACMSSMKAGCEVCFFTTVGRCIGSNCSAECGQSTDGGATD